MRVLVTGATSMIGVELCKALIENGHIVIAVIRRQSDREKCLPVSENLKRIYLNMDQYSHLSSLLTETIDVAVFLAWNGTRGEARDNCDIQVANCQCNLILLQELIKLECKKVLSAGSQAEYGPCFSNECQTELTESQPNTAYGIQKLRFYTEAANICKVNQIAFIEPRIFSLYGPNDYKDSLVMSMLKKMRNNEVCDLTECNQMWNYLYVTDAISALMCLLFQECKSGIYNVGYNISKPLKAFIDEMYYVTKSSSILNYGAIPYPNTGMVSINPSVKKMMALGWYPKVTFKEGIEQILKTEEFSNKED